MTITIPTSGNTFITNSQVITFAGTAADDRMVTLATWSSNRGGSGTATLGGTPTAATWTADVPLASGVNVLTVTVQDETGTQATDTLTVTLDTAAPVLTITSPTAAATVGLSTAAITLGGTASDAMGVTQVTWSNNRGGSGTASGTTSWSANLTLQTGVNVLTVTARDAANNTANDTLTVTVDLTAPVVTIMAPTAANTFVTTATAVTVGGMALDPEGVTQVTWVNHNGGQTGTATLSGTPTAASWSATVALPSGNNVLMVTAWDAGNNTATDTLTVGDGSLPLIGVLDTFTGSGGTPLTAHAADAAPFGSSWTSVGGSTPVLRDGTLQSAGGSGFVVATIDSGLSDGVVAAEFRSQGTAGTQYAGVILRAVDSNNLLLLRYASTPTAGILQLFQRVAGEFFLVAGTTTLPPGAAGTLHRMEARFVGSAITALLDNAVIFTTSVNLYQTATRHGVLWHIPSDPSTTFDNFAVRPDTPDTTAPVVTFTTPTTAPTFTSGTAALTVGGAATDAVGVTQVTWNNDRGGSGTASLGGTATSPTWTANLTLALGVNVLMVTARDAANNTATNTLTVTYTPLPDTTSPGVTITTPTAASTFAMGTAALTLGGTATDNAAVNQVTWSNDRGGSGTASLSGTATAATWTANVTLAPGANVLTVTAWDAANNSSTDTLTVTYDPSMPSGVLDTFTGSSGTPLTSHAADVAPVGAAWTVLDGAPSLQNGALAAAGGSGFVVATINSGLSDGVVAADFSSPGAAGTQYAGVVFRAVDGSNLLLLRYASTPASGILQLFVRVGGNFTLWAGTTTLPPGAAGALHRLEARFVGSAITAVLDNAVIFTASVNLHQTATRHGLLWHIPSDSGATFDNFAMTGTVVPPGADTIAPGVAITTPTASSTFTTGTAAFTLGGTATDAVGVTQVTWSNDQGGSGTATLGGTATSATWTANLTLVSGANVLTVTARDAANNSATDTLTVTYTPGAPSVVLDTFTGSNGTLLTAHAADTAPGGAAWTSVGGSTPVLQDGTLRSAGGSGFVVATINSGLSDGMVAADFSSPGATGMQYAGVVFRAVDSSNLLLLRYASTSASGILQLFVRVGGNFTLVAGTTTLPPGVAGALHRLEARFVGSAITAVLDNAVIFTASVNLHQTATRHGLLWHIPSDSGATFDNFTVLPPAPDATAPVVTITTPTTAVTFTSGTAAFTVGGTATDNTVVNSVTWSNDRGGSGTASLGGTATDATWTANLTLAPGANVLTVTAQDAANNSATDTLTVTYSPPLSIRLDVGNTAAFTDSAGNAWLPDQFGSGGTVASKSNAIGNTVDDGLYRTYRFGSFNYAVPVANGTYDVYLEFIEPYWGAPGQRVFSVSAEGATSLANIDLYAIAGTFTAVQRTLSVTVSDGVLNLSFASSVDNAIVSAIAMVRRP